MAGIYRQALGTWGIGWELGVGSWDCEFDIKGMSNTSVIANATIRILSYGKQQEYPYHVVPWSKKKEGRRKVEVEK